MQTFNNSVLDRSLALATAKLQQFANQADFIDKLRVAFGDNFDANIALGIASQFQAGDFSLIPDIQVLSNGELAGANGAYAGTLDEIFVSSDFLAQHPDDLNAVSELLRKITPLGSEAGEDVFTKIFCELHGCQGLGKLRIEGALARDRKSVV